jgi:hypothetical protein
MHDALLPLAAYEEVQPYLANLIYHQSIIVKDTHATNPQ